MIIQNVISYDQFINYINKYDNVIVNISATWCKPCNIVKPLIDKFLSVIDDIDFIYLKIDMDIIEEYSEFKKFFEIKKIPYFSFIKKTEIINYFHSSDFNFISKKIFENISKEREIEKIKYNDINIDEKF